MKWQDIIIWIMFIISIAVVLWYFLGNSPTLEEAILVLLIMLTITNMVQITKVQTELKSLRLSFNALAKDFKEHIK
jgi:uncharacterized protein YsxB (DUF464 family)